jgi:septal ring factor EnvC (AmiA/AmiB activator)
MAAPEPPAADGTGAARAAEATDDGAGTATETDTAPEKAADTNTGTDTGAQAPSPDERSVADLLTDLQRLHREAEEATEAYDATGEELTKQRAEVTRLDRRLATARLSLHDSRSAAGRLARQQYQNSSTALSPYVRLLMTHDPHRALEQGHVIGQVARERADTVERLVGSEQDTDALARKARAALDRQLTLTERRKREHDTVRDRLDEVEELLSSLTPEQLTAIKKSEKKATAEEELGESDAPKFPSTPGS